MRRGAHHPGGSPGGPSLNTGLPLSVSVSCVPYSGTTYNCTATASGGSGTGYSFTWYGTVSEYYDRGGTSKAYTQCNKYYTSGYASSGYLYAGAQVTDSNGNTASGGGSQSC